MGDALTKAGQLSEDIGTIVFASPTDVHFGLSTFKDIPEEAQEFGILPYDMWVGTVKGLKSSGGGDAAEASLNSLDHMLNVDWVNETGIEEGDELSIYVIHMTDAPWHHDGDGSGFSEGLTITGVASGYIVNEINYIGVQFPYAFGLDMKTFVNQFPDSASATATFYKFKDFGSTTTLAGIIASTIKANEPFESWTICGPDGKLIELTGTCEEPEYSE